MTPELVLVHGNTSYPSDCNTYNTLLSRGYGNSDEIVCATGSCTVDGVHSSQLTNENASYTLSESHFGLVRNTAARQADLIQ